MKNISPGAYFRNFTVSSFSVILSELPLLKSLFFDRREYQDTCAVDFLLLQNTVGTENVTPSIKNYVAYVQSRNRLSRRVAGR